MNRVLIFILFSIIIISCKEDEPTAPEVETPNSKVIAEATIGSEGGILETDNFKLTIPSGSLTNQVELKLMLSYDTHPFQENSRSEFFRIEGLPVDYSKSLRFAVKYNSNLEEESFMIIGEEGIDASSGDADVFYDFLDVVDSSGYLVAQLPADSNSAALNKSTNDKKWNVITVVSNFFKHMEGYKIYYPKTGVNPGLDIVTSLDNAFKTYIDSLRLLPRADIPKIFVGNLGADVYCKFKWRNRTGKKKEKGVIGINYAKTSEVEKMRIMIGREVLRFLLFGYDPQFPVMVGPSQQNYHWLNEAIISWAEHLLVRESEKDSYVPTNFEGNELKPLDGIYEGRKIGDNDLVTNSINHGAGMSSFIYYLFKNQKKRDIRDICKDIQRGEHPVKCIDKLINEWYISRDIDDRWLNYIRDYIKGKVYSVNPNKFINGIDAKNTFNVNSEDDKEKKFNMTYPDLSAKFFKFNVNNKELDNRLELVINVKPVISVTDKSRYVDIYKWNGTIISNYSYVLESLVIPNIKKLADNNESLLFFVINTDYDKDTYSGTKSIELNFKVRRAEFNRCRIQIIFLGEYSYPYTGNSFTVTELNWEGPISYSAIDDSFIGYWDEERYGKNYKGELNIEIDPNTKHIKNFEASEIRTEPDGDEYSYLIISKDIDLKTNYDGNFRDYKVNGNDVCNYISNIKYTGGDQYTGFNLENHSCQSDSYLNIYFYNEE